jgi:hypothetical protein
MFAGRYSYRAVQFFGQQYQELLMFRARLQILEIGHAALGYVQDTCKKLSLCLLKVER